MPSSSKLSPSIADIRRSITPVPASTSVLAFGVGAIDDRLVSGGLGTEALHEFAPSSSSLSDDAAATLFVAGVAARLCQASVGGQVMWALTRFDLYAPGLEQAGLGADRLFFAEARDDAQALAAAEDGVREGALAAVVVEVRRASMVATRRLQLAAAEGGTPVLMLRRWRRAAACPLNEPSAAATRWRVGSSPSSPLGIPGVGRARWSIDLVRQRGGEPFSLIVEACDDQGRLALPAAVRDRAAAPERAIARAA